MELYPCRHCKCLDTGTAHVRVNTSVPHRNGHLHVLSNWQQALTASALSISTTTTSGRSHVKHAPAASRREPQSTLPASTRGKSRRKKLTGLTDLGQPSQQQQQQELSGERSLQSNLDTSPLQPSVAPQLDAFDALLPDISLDDLLSGNLPASPVANPPPSGRSAPSPRPAARRDAMPMAATGTGAASGTTRQPAMPLAPGPASRDLMHAESAANKPAQKQRATGASAKAAGPLTGPLPPPVGSLQQATRSAVPADDAAAHLEGPPPQHLDLRHRAQHADPGTGLLPRPSRKKQQHDAAAASDAVAADAAVGMPLASTAGGDEAGSTVSLPSSKPRSGRAPAGGAAAEGVRRDAEGRSSTSAGTPRGAVAGEAKRVAVPPYAPPQVVSAEQPRPRPLATPVASSGAGPGLQLLLPQRGPSLATTAGGDAATAAVVHSTRQRRSARLRGGVGGGGATAAAEEPAPLAAAAATSSSSSTKARSGPLTAPPSAWRRQQQLQLGLPNELDLELEADDGAIIGGEAPLQPLVLPAGPLQAALAAAEVLSSAGSPWVSSEQLPEYVDSTNWRLHAAVLFPGVYDADWHASLFELLFDLWPVVGKAAANGHSGGSSSAAGGSLPATAFGFAARCNASADFYVRASLALSVVDCLEDHLALMDLFARRLPLPLLLKVLVPLAHQLRPEVAAAFAEAVSEVHDTKLPPGGALLARRWAALLVLLRSWRAVHPAAGLELTCLGAILDMRAEEL